MSGWAWKVAVMIVWLIPVRVRRINLLRRDNDDEFDEVLSRRQSLNKYTEWQRVPEDSMEFQNVPPSFKRFLRLGTGQEDLTVQGFSSLQWCLEIFILQQTWMADELTELSKHSGISC